MLKNNNYEKIECRECSITYYENFDSDQDAIRKWLKDEYEHYESIGYTDDQIINQTIQV
jgi:hypothetical protein